ncbi:hypothetical protein LCGC14_3045720 [marine sediment metagenome]|uniref:Uncharacterized protein n=1 Tax=marine sediment metagenome TaxID=412755 RepID=A0A0F8WN61_9ZZZZ
MNIPLTMKHEEKDFPFFKMPKVSLLKLLDIENKRALAEELKIVDDWIKNERCECSKNPLIKNKKIALDCEHLNKKISENKIISDSKSKIEKMSSALHYRTMFGHFAIQDKGSKE